MIIQKSLDIREISWYIREHAWGKGSERYRVQECNICPERRVTTNVQRESLYGRGELQDRTELTRMKGAVRSGNSRSMSNVLELGLFSIACSIR